MFLHSQAMNFRHKFNRADAAPLASRDAVDAIVLFDASTPEELLERLRPEIVVKGRDVKEDEVVGREIAENTAGEWNDCPCSAI